MKLKTLLLAMATAALAACSSSDDDGIVEAPFRNPIPETEVYAGIKNVGDLQQVNAATRADASILPTTAKVDAYFSIRMDSYLKQKDSKGTLINPSKYYPEAGSNVPMLPENTGKIYTNCPLYPFKTDLSKSMEYYIFSTDGSATANVIAEAPTMEQVLSAKETEAKANITIDNSLLPADVDPAKIHVIWYVVKKETRGDKAWHVDGIVTDLDNLQAVRARTPGITFSEEQVLEDQKFDPNAQVDLPLDKEVIVDVHQQEHKDWGEIKTSIHIKSPNDVKVFLPIVDSLIVNNAEIRNDIRIRDFEAQIDAATLNDSYAAKLKVNVERNETGITINVTGLTPVLLKAIEERYEDGLTVEVHTFTTFNEKDINTVWGMMRKAYVKTDAKVSGQITSAYNKIATNNMKFNEQGEAVYDDGNN